jgi:hypothetical protein
MISNDAVLKVKLACHGFPDCGGVINSLQDSVYAVNDDKKQFLVTVLGEVWIDCRAVLVMRTVRLSGNH